MDEGMTDIPVSRLKDISFRQYTTQEIKALSVLEITNPQTFNNFSHPTYGGLHDPALGPNGRQDLCSSCGLGHVFCPGHMGHIQLPLPVYNPVYFSMFIKLLKISCFGCHRIMVNNFECSVLMYQIAILQRGDIAGCFKVGEFGSHLLAERGKETYDILQPLKENIAQNYPFLLPSEKCDDKESAEHVINTRNSQAVKNSLIKDFLKNVQSSVASTSARCPHCGQGKRTLRQKYNTTIGLYGRSPHSDKRSKKNACRKPDENNEEAASPDNGDEDEVVDMDEPDKADGKTGDDMDETIFKDSNNYTVLTPTVLKQHVRQIWKVSGPLLKVLFQSMSTVPEGSHPMDIFFLDVIPVCPTRYRPITLFMGHQYENPQTASLCKIVQDRITIMEILQSINTKIQGEELASDAVLSVEGKNLSQKLNFAWTAMQNHVNLVLDGEMDKLSREKGIGIKQVLEKKAGLFRKNMMGKRVNYAARSVISPDPCINVSEIGVPLVFATKLTYPQPVTPWNFKELKQMVINGPEKHPGATMVEMETGWKVFLNKSDKGQREAIAKQLLTPSKTNSPVMKPKIVYRHLKNGDYMLLNRQPTLHKPSIQAHKVRVLPNQKTLRLHYANCKAYNADFDGDEMNAHFPQSELARAEAMCLASTSNQYLVPKDGSPLAGLIQDHMVSGVSLTLRGRFFSRADYCQLVYGALTDVIGPVKCLPPAIIKPRQLWSGKQVLSSVILNVIPPGKKPLNLDGKAKIPEKNWTLTSDAVSRGVGDLADMGESKVVIRDGELLQGVLDKAHYGNTRYGLVHCCHELYGGDISGQLLSSLGKLFRVFLQLRGFTLGVEDILVQPKADHKRRKFMKKAPARGRVSVIKALGLTDDITEEEMKNRMRDAHFDKDDRGMQEQDLAMKMQTDIVQNNIVQACIPRGLHKPFPYNNLQLMVEAGAKGSTVNCMQISCLLGQIELEGRRPPIMISGRSLPVFLPYDPTPRAGGFVAGRFLTGIKPPEYFFHCMAGREGLIDTAVKTSRSGYLQRCIVKHLEGVQVAYDMTVRDSDGSVIQFRYGEDGLETCRTPFLSQGQFPFLLHNRHADGKLDDKTDLKLAKTVDKHNHKIESWNRKHYSSGKKRVSGFLKFCRDMSDRGAGEGNDRTKNGRSVSANQLMTAWRELDNDSRKGYTVPRCPVPALIKFQPLHCPNVMSENLQHSVDNFCVTQLDNVLKSMSIKDDVSSACFKNLFSSKVIRAFAQPGEAVGLVCAQSIGEPSTQMTLNTFHFAGRGEMNVTLGIPRLKEILQTAGPNIKTPAMDIPVHPTPEAYQKAKALKIKLSKVMLTDVLKEIDVKEFLTIHSRQLKKRNFRVTFTFLPESSFSETCYSSQDDVLIYMETHYVKSLARVLKKKMRANAAAKNIDMSRMQTKDIGDIDTAGGDNDDMSDVDPNDGDAVTVKEQSRKADSKEYDEEGGEEETTDLLVKDSDDDNDDPGDVNNDKDSDGDDSLYSVEMSDRTSLNKSGPVKGPSQITDTNLLSDVITDYRYDADNGRWCTFVFTYELQNSKLDMLSVIQSTLKSAIVHEVKGLKQTFLVEEKGSNGMEWHLKTEGVNMENMYQYSDILDLNRLYTNNVHEFAAVYGVEAAARILLKEISNVFAAYGINVDYRHLSLLTDYMTFEGMYKGLNRSAIDNNIAPFQKISFETGMKFIIDASINGNTDTLMSPSSRIVTGQVLKCGTGCFEIKKKLV